MRGDLTRVPGEGLGPPEAPCGAGALPRGEDGEEDKPSMSCLNYVEKDELGNPFGTMPIDHANDTNCDLCDLYDQFFGSFRIELA